MPHSAVRGLQIGLVGLAVACAVVPLDADAVEWWFSTGIYPPMQRMVTSMTNVVPFALLDVLTLAAAGAVIATVIVAVRCARVERRLLPLARAAGGLAVAAAVLYLAFLLLWGFNYRRVPMLDRLALAHGAPSTDDVVRLGLEAAARLNALHDVAHATGWSGDEWRDESLRTAFHTVQRALSDAPLAQVGRLKSSMYGPYFRWTSVDGMMNPFALEVLANPDLLPFERPFVAAHEWAHLAGYADESEANFVAWLTCLRGAANAQYSGWLYLYWQVVAGVAPPDRTALHEALAAGPRRDLDAIAQRTRDGQLPMLRRASWQVYDRYLKANRVEEGVRSYSAVLTIILRARFEDGWTPVRRDRSAPPAP